MRRQFSLPADDVEWLDARGGPYELVAAPEGLRTILYGVPVPPGYNRLSVDLYFKIDPGYPDSQIDMVYFSPALQLLSGRAIQALAGEAFEGKNWQRWSRHRTQANPWRPGVDGLATHYGLVQDWLERELRKDLR
jgi:hypothetical protein